MDEQWRFEVRDAFAITGRGLGLTGTLTGHIERSPDNATVVVDGVSTRDVVVHVKSLSGNGGDELALLLPGVPIADVPVGSVIIGRTQSSH